MSNLSTITGNSDPVLVMSATGTGASATTFIHNSGAEMGRPGQLFPAVYEFAITDIVGVFSALQINLEWSPITVTNTPQFQTVGTWTPLTSPVVFFPCSSTGTYRLNCTSFTGGTSFNVYCSIASSMPQSTGGGGGGGSVTQGTVPWVDNITQVAGVALGATAVVAYGSTPAAVNVPGVNAFITNAGSIGGGVQFADNAASGGTPTGTLAMAWDSVNSKIRANKADASQNLLVALGAALPAGTNVIGHVIVDSGSVSVLNFPATQNIAGITTDGTTTETNFLVVGGETNDATAQYQPIPLGPSGRSVIAEGIAADASAPVGSPVLVGGVDSSTTMRYLPVGQSGGTIGHGFTFVPVGGRDILTGFGQQLEFNGGALIATLLQVAPASITNSTMGFFPTANGGAFPIGVAPYVYNVATNAWDRLADAGVVGTVGVGGAVASGTPKQANPVPIAGVFNSPQPTVTNGQVVEAQSTASGALIIATGVDPFSVSISSEPATAPLLQANEQQQREMVLLECIRRALVAIATDGGRAREIDFDPTFVAAEQSLT